MADFEAGMTAVSQHFATAMAEREPDVRIVWANGPPPASPFDGRSDEWVRFTFLPVDDRAAAIGPSLYRGTALIDVQVFTPLGKGMGPAQRIRRSVQEAMREPVAGVAVGPAVFGTSGESSGWYQNQIRFRLTIDEAAA